MKASKRSKVYLYHWLISSEKSFDRSLSTKNCFSQTYPDFNITLDIIVELATDVFCNLFLLPGNAMF